MPVLIDVMLEGGEERNTYVVSALGGVGTGKSSLLNAITAEYTFETGDGTDVSCSCILSACRVY